jgi:hypothetical protein
MPPSRRPSRRRRSPAARPAPVTQPIVAFRDYLSLTVGIFLFVLPFLPIPRISGLESYTYIPSYQFLILLLVATLLLGFTGLGLISRQLAWPTSRFLPLFALLIAARVVSAIPSLLPHNSFWGTYGGWADGILYLLAIGSLLIVVLSLRLTGPEIMVYLYALLTQAVILSGQTISSALQKGAMEKVVRVHSPLHNANHFIGYALLLIPLAAVVAYRTWRSSAARWQKGLATLPILTLPLALFFTFPVELQRILVPAYRTATAEPVPAARPQEFLASPSNAERFTQMELGWRIGRQHPWTGSGAGTTREAFYQHVADLPDWNYAIAMDNPHSDAIEQFSQYGILGLLAYAIFWAGLARAGGKIRRRVPVEFRPHAYALASGILLFLIFNQVFFTTVITGAYLWFAIALLLALLGLAESPSTPPGKVWNLVRWVGFSALILVMMWSSYWFIRHFTAERNVARAQQAVAAARQSREERDFFPAASYAELAVAQYPHQAFYHMFASNYSIMPLVSGQIIDRDERSATAAKALEYARQAVTLNPHIPHYRQNVSILQYYLSPSGSDEERQAVEDMHANLTADPWDYPAYRRVVEIYTIKGNWSLADTRLPLLINQAPESLRPPLEEFVNSYYYPYKKTVLEER